MVKLKHGDNIQLLKKMKKNSIDSVVTDPPYGLSAAKNSGKTSKGGFMGKRWDHDVPTVEFWQEVFRVLKPGGHVLSFGGTRTYHRLVCAIEDAGLEIRDQIQWLYGTGFPKSHNVSKGIDKKFGQKREVTGPKLRPDGSFRIKTDKKDGTSFKSGSNDKMLTVPASDQAKEWDGWGTALKPANEPICLARKPLSEKTVVANVLRWGTGAINVDGCRVGTDTITQHGRNDSENTSMSGRNYKESAGRSWQGRFPANVIMDSEAGVMLDEQKDGASRYFYCAKASKSERNAGLKGMEEKQCFGDGGGTYQGLSNSKNPSQNYHPTVKPVTLMRYLCRLITPPNGIVLDPFMGSGTTGIAAQVEDFGFIGMEMDKEYFKIAQKRAIF